MKVYLFWILKIVAAGALFFIVRTACDFSVGALDWFFKNLPSDQSPQDYPVLHALSIPFADFILVWLPVVCALLSVFLFAMKKIKTAFLLVAFPLLPAVIAYTLFYNAAQMHVPPGETLFGSGVLIGEKPSAALLKETSYAD